MSTNSAGLPDGLYEALLTKDLEDRIAELLGREAELALLPPVDIPRRLAEHVRNVLERALRAEGLSKPQSQRELVNRLVHAIEQSGSGDEVAEGPRILNSIFSDPTPGLGLHRSLVRPEIPLTQDTLLVNARSEPKLAAELRHEIVSADRIDLISAFVVWTGLRVVLDELKSARDRGVPIRVITTTYTGTTDPRALDELVALGAQVKVSYETGATRLHAKAWLFERNSGFSTAYVGSSNLTHTAIHEGIEWNVRLSQQSSPTLLDRFRAAFETYWRDATFADYDPARFREAIARIKSSPEQEIAILDVQPHDFQRRILERLDVERQRFDRHRNLIVAATGTGKTVIAALDYRRLSATWGKASLLFVAHREEILKQSCTMFRTVMRNGSFGSLLVGGHKPEEPLHLFASIQSLHHQDLESWDPGIYDVVIVDEFHHAQAPTYRRLLQHLRPRELIGLTATPERMDQLDVTEWFDHHVAAELRLWEAIDQGLLCPFQYFGLADDVALDQVQFRHGRYDSSELSRIYTGHDARVAKILEAVRRLIARPSEMRAFGFCVSVEHAHYMSRRFSDAGIPSAVVVGDTPADERAQTLNRLRNGEISCVFSVEVFNEGVDVPEIDTVLFLRPTESATVFLQQLGRGLRRTPGKSGLTVLDFIGVQNRNFRFAPRFAALAGLSEGRVQAALESDFPYLPTGCSIKLDRVSRDIVLASVRQALQGRVSHLVAELKEVGDVDLADFLSRTDRRLDQIYRVGGPGWSFIRRQAGFEAPAAGPEDRSLVQAIRRFIHVDDDERTQLFSNLLRMDSAPDPDSLGPRAARLLDMLLIGLWPEGKVGSRTDALNALWASPAIRDELVQVLTISAAAAPSLTTRVDLPERIPLLIHARYSRDEILVALGNARFDRPPTSREGVISLGEEKLDAFFVTLDKSGSSFSPTTRYRDYPISPTEFHWESQSTTPIESATGQRYIGAQQPRWRFLLFVREALRTPDGRTCPFLFLGPVRHVAHQGSRPIQITWRLESPMPAGFFEAARIAV